MHSQLFSKKPIRLYLVLFCVALCSFFVFPQATKAELTLPSTPCGDAHVNMIVNLFSVHLQPYAVKESGGQAFDYSITNNDFVSLNNNLLTFHFKLSFVPDSQANIKFLALDPACNAVYGFGPAFLGFDPATEITATYDKSTYTTTVNGIQISSLPSAGPKYIWVEVWDGKPNSSFATFSYLVDVDNPQNPVGAPQPPPEPEGKRPVLIVPGVVGTELYNGGDLIWPNLSQMFWDINDQFLIESLALDVNGISINQINAQKAIEKILDVPFININIFEGVRQFLETQGYVVNETLNFFPYDWRLNLSLSRNLLDEKIEEIKTRTGFKKVDIIAHSMGGLLVKDYLAEHGKNSVNKLIFVGTPHLGAPKAARVLLYGDRFGIPWLEEDRIQEIAVNSPASYELLPSQKYFDQFVGYIRKDFLLFPDPPLNYADTKNFLLSKGLNSTVFGQAESFFSKNLQDLDLSGIDTYNIAGCKYDTPAGYQYGLGNWFINSLRYTSGDKTVPLVSADYLNIAQDKKFYIKKGSHAELPSFLPVRNLILGILNGNISTDQNEVSNSSSFCNFKGKEMVWKSPVEVHIYDSQGHHTGPVENNGIEYGIDSVSYEVIDHQKFVFLPTDEGQSYHVVAKGLEKGTFDLRISNNNNGEITQSTIFNDVPVTDLSFVQFNLSDQTADNIIQVDENGTGDFQNVAADSTLNPVQSEDIISSQTQLTIDGTLGQNGWYTSTITTTLTSTDENSGVLYTKFSLNNGVTFQTYNHPLNIDQEGIITIQNYSVDRAGNNEPVQTKIISIDKTPPEIIVEFSLQNSNFIFSTKDNLDPTPAIFCSSNSCLAKDQAGNQTALLFKKTKLLAWYNLELVSITYNNQQPIIFPKNLLVVKYISYKGSLIDFNQTWLIKGQEIIRIDYQKAQNRSVIWSWGSGGLSRQVIPGVKILQLSIQESNIKTVIK